MAQAILHQLSLKWQAHMETFFIIMIFMQLYLYWLLDMFNNDNIMTIKASEILQKVLTDKKIITNAPCAL